jgi:hypothetical protein
VAFILRNSITCCIVLFIKNLNRLDYIYVNLNYNVECSNHHKNHPF